MARRRIAILERFLIVLCTVVVPAGVVSAGLVTQGCGGDDEGADAGASPDLDSGSDEMDGSTPDAADGQDSGDAGDLSDGSDDAGAWSDAGPDFGEVRTLTPIDSPVADDCITDVSAGDHTFTCGDLTFLVMVDEMCTTGACGLIFDVHGGTMSGLQMRDNTHLHELAPPYGYIVVHPSATDQNTGGSWDLEADPPVIADFMDRMIDAFHVDEARVHVTGFSQGSGVTFWFLCHRPELLASTAPISGQSASSILAPDGSACVEFINPDWQPRVPILFMSGTLDTALLIEDARARVEGLVDRLELTGGEQIAGDDAYRRMHWEGEGGMVLDYLEHDYGGQAVLDGHCIPGGTDIDGSANNFIANATTCTTGDINIHWGEIALEWFIQHPKQ